MVLALGEQRCKSEGHYVPLEKGEVKNPELFVCGGPLSCVRLFVYVVYVGVLYLLVCITQQA